MKIDYNNLYTYFIFNTFKREASIPKENRVRIEKYVTGIINNNSSKLYAIYINPEHAHLLISRSPSISEEQIATIIADSTEKFINENNLAKGYFSRQQSASAFSVSKSDVDKVCKYILNQPVHHKKITFTEEYDQFLRFYQESIYKIK